MRSVHIKNESKKSPRRAGTAEREEERDRRRNKTHKTAAIKTRNARLLFPLYPVQCHVDAYERIYRIDTSLCAPNQSGSGDNAALRAERARERRRRNDKISIHWLNDVKVRVKNQIRFPLPLSRSALRSFRARTTEARCEANSEVARRLRCAASDFTDDKSNHQKNIKLRGRYAAKFSANMSATEPAERIDNGHAISILPEQCDPRTHDTLRVASRLSADKRIIARAAGFGKSRQRPRVTEDDLDLS